MVGTFIMTKRPLHLSYSAIADFKACPTRFRNKYVLGLRTVEDTEVQRVGTNWHRILDIATRKPGSVCTRCANEQANDPECTLCAGTGFLPDDIMDAVTREINRIYSEKTFSDPIAAETERVKLLYSLSGYRWYYSEQPEEVITREQHFDLTLRNPETGHTLPNVRLVGCIDKIINWNGHPAIKEHKSTSNSVDPDSTYWGHLNLDTQTTLYLYAARRWQADGLLESWGIKASDPLISKILYDVWHRPQISPKKLTQAESKKFVADGEYCGQKFEVIDGDKEPLDPRYSFIINGCGVDIEPGAKPGTFAIQETPEMYGARLLADIVERPEFYFRCVELSRINKEMESFEYELVNIYRTMQEMIRTGHWYGNEQQCEAKYKCDYISCCYNGVDVESGIVPDGFKLIFDKEK